MSMSTVGRVATGVAIGAAAVGAGIWAADANAARTKRITLERGTTNFLDKTGLPGGFPDAAGIFAAGGAAGAAALVATGRVSGPRAFAAIPAAAALGAVAGFMLGRRIGEHQATTSPQWADVTSQREAGRAARREEFDAQVDAARETQAIMDFQDEWRTDDDVASVTFQEAATNVMDAFDHNDDGLVDLRDGQLMAADERVAMDRGGWRGGASGPPLDPKDQVETLLPWFSGADAAGNGDGRASVDEVAGKLQTILDKDGDERLAFTEGVSGTWPRGLEINDYEDFVG